MPWPNNGPFTTPRNKLGIDISAHTSKHMDEF